MARRRESELAQDERPVRRAVLQGLGAWAALRALGACVPEESAGRAPAPGPGGERDGTLPGLNMSDASAERGLPRVACARATYFVEPPDDGLRHGVTSFHATQTADWVVSGLSGALFQTTVPDTLLRMLRTLGSMYLGYPLTVLEHSLQTATRARRAGASEDLVLAALLHHVGMAVSVEGYAELSAAMVRGHVSEDTYRIIRHHPEYAAKHYGEKLGQATDERARYASRAFHADAVRFADDWERVAYDPAYPSLPLEDFEPLIRARFASLALENPYPTQHDCI